MVNTMRTHPLPSILATLLASSSIGGVHAANYYGPGGYLATQQLHLQLPQQRQQQQLQLRHPQQQQLQAQRQTQKQQQSSQTQLLFCGQCIWKNTMVCDFRADFLLNNYDDITTLEEAQQGILDAGNTQCSSADGNPPKSTTAGDGGGGVGKIVNLDLFCNTCPWKSAGFNCEARVGYLQSAWKLTQKSAQESLLEKGDCIDPTWNGTDVYIDDPNYVPGEENLFDLDHANNNGGGNNNQGGDGGQGGGGGGEVIEDIILFCSSCPYPNSPDTTCEEAAKALANENNDMSLEEAKVSILQECFRDPDDEGDDADTDAVEMEEESNSLSAGGIVGIVFALVLIILAIIIICLVCARRRRKRLQEEDVKVGETEVVEKDVENPEADNADEPMVVQAVPVPSKEEEEVKVPPPECAPEEEQQIVRPDPPALGEDDYGTVVVGNDDLANNVGRSTDPPEARSVEDIMARYANGNNSVDDERGSDVGVGDDEEVVPIRKDGAGEQTTENAATPADENVGSEGEQEGIVTAENSATENQGGNANGEIKPILANDDNGAIESQEAPQSSSSPNDDPHTLAASSGDSLNTEILNTQSHVGEIYVNNQSSQDATATESKQSLNIAPVVAMEEQLAAPCPLSESETSTLRDMLKSQLILANEDDEEDAENLLDYALGMVESGENVGLITEELKFMEMSICDEEAASKLGICLTKYFRGMNGTQQ